MEKTDATTIDGVLQRLSRTDGGVLVVNTGGHTHRLKAIPGWRERLFVRIPPAPSALSECLEMGLCEQNLICMQGPFAAEMNRATMRMYHITAVVQGAGADAHDRASMAAAAHECGADLYVLTEHDQNSQVGPVAPGGQRAGAPQPPEPLHCGRFPAFLDLAHRPVLVVGGGRIAQRRVQALLEFGADVTVIAPEITPALREWAHRIRWIPERYRELGGDYILAVAATDRREVNRQVGEDAARAGVLASVSDCKEESTFWFPATVRKDNLVIGITSTNGDHRAVKELAARLRTNLEGTDE